MKQRLGPLRQHLSGPLMADLLRDRAVGWALLGAAGLQAGASVLGLPGWLCPFRFALGCPCPGCGLARSIAALLKGEWRSGLAYHAFGPLALVALLLIVGASLLPEKQRDWLIQWVERLERRTGLSALALIGLFCYWLVRLLLFRGVYARWVLG
jgi:hypothetical protein